MGGGRVVDEAMCCVYAEDPGGRTPSSKLSLGTSPVEVGVGLEVDVGEVLEVEIPVEVGISDELVELVDRRSLNVTSLLDAKVILSVLVVSGVTA